MKFNYASTPAHPRKIYTIMKNFVNENVTLMRDIDYTPIPPAGLTAEEWFEQVLNTEPVIETEKVLFHVHKGNKCAAWDTDEFDTPICNITMCPEELTSGGAEAIFRNACSRSATLKGFAKITFALLHEVGHFMVAEEMQGVESTIERPEDIISYAFDHSNNWKEFHDVYQSFHYNQPEEKAATDWAINFLSDPNNRKITKAFEKEFFKAWRG